MHFAYVQRRYTKPGVYQWVKPNTAPGTGPFGSTYLQTNVICIGPGSGGASGAASQSPANAGGVGISGGVGGAGGAYFQATYLAANLSPLMDVIVGAGTKGGAPVVI